MYNKKSKIKDAPQRIYLTTGLSEVEALNANFNDLKDVTWCEHRISDGDIEYRRMGVRTAKPIDWQQVRINAAISIASRANLKLEGLINNYKNSVAKISIELADALVEELMKRGSVK
ncbi:hypothetical protein [Hoylesella loescheii]|uniref:Uncharacterized protein n=1 Tax=Hoylesella loescheii DSM 19665 = JCM 12249 = ATCC 15930 TaxID=1122985 RepID=A0A069QGE7_HOYLO|nr:hypothetical protein [Hoylesella loescheii]KDR51732.1 hypothetical protein HMPREF1991_02245 [Hoylesella loescheii DSM 19665 = JCM 12249 = ATCC 15930]